MLDKIAGLSAIQIELLAAFLLLEGIALAAIPEEIIILSLGVLWGQGRVGFLESLFAAQLGLLPANVFPVIVGNKLGRKILTIPPFSWMIRKDILERALGYLNKNGSLTIFITRFTPVIRGPVYLAVGVCRISPLEFLKIDALASCVHIPLMLLLGRLVGKYFSVEVVYRGIVIAAVVGFVSSIFLLALDFYKRKTVKNSIGMS
jgi:membrane protein DedA with SNARE-associated domain